jgi:Kelch motif
MEILLAQSKTESCAKLSAGRRGMLQSLGLTSVVMLALIVTASAQIQTRTHKPTPRPDSSKIKTGRYVKTPTALGAWTPLVNAAPENVGLMMLLSDGTVAANGSDDNTWYKLTPDSTGSYVNGTWSTLASMAYQRLYVQSAVLPSGNLYISGGEYGNGPTGSAEMYDPTTDTWTGLANATSVYPDMNFSDGVSMVLPNGNLLAYSVGGTDCIDSIAGIYEGSTLIYDVPSNTWSAAPCSLGDQDESSWVKLPDDSILTLNLYSTTSERYIPSTNQWVTDAVPPAYIFNDAGEVGGAFLLPNGKVFYIGGTNQTMIYTPSGNTSPGSWVLGPTLPTEVGPAIGANDAPAAMMVNGKILMTASGLDCDYCGPTYFFVYDYKSNKITAIDAPGGGASNPNTSFVMDMLDLPDGSILTEIGGTQLYTFKPVGLVAPINKPVISAVTANGDGSYHVTGTGFNGISGGADYGDENQNATNYPIAKLLAQNGSVYYARTYNWSSTGVATGSLPVSTEMTLPVGLPKGTYRLSISANGLSSPTKAFKYKP